jgi:microcystin-dependent protein
MSFPKVVIKYEIPPAPVYPPTTSGGGGTDGGTGGGGGGDGGGGGGSYSIVSTTSAGLAPIIPTDLGHAPHIFLRNDAAWQQIAYADLASVPATFTPSAHATSHVTGPDFLPLVGAHNPGFVPSLPTNSSLVFKGAGLWASVAYAELLGTPSGFTPTAHALTHKAGGTDVLRLDELASPTDTTVLNASTAAHGLLRKLDNNPAHFLDGTGAWTPGAVGPQGPQGVTGSTGPQGVNAFSATTADFDLPVLGNSVQITLADASWITIGQMVVVQTAGGDPTDAYSLQVTAKSGNTVTLQNVGSSTSIPLAGTNQRGLLNQLSGLTSDFVDGTNNCRDLRSSVASVTAQVPTGTVVDFAGSSAPAGWLLCDGNPYPTATYPSLFSAIGYIWGGSGANFNVPDLRSRVTVGAGAGAGLTSRTLAGKGGEETHPLTIAELASHTHGLSTHTHTLGSHTHSMDHYHLLSNHTHLGVDHLHSMQGHTHAGINHLHGMDHYHNWGVQGSHTHGVTGGNIGMTNPVQGVPVTGGASFYTPTSIGIAAANTPAGNTVYASQTSGGWVNTGAADRDLTTGGPSVGTTGAADRGLTTGGPSPNNTQWASETNAAYANTGGPSTNTTAGPSIDATTANGSGTAHNTMPPFAVMNKIIKT